MFLLTIMPLVGKTQCKYPLESYPQISSEQVSAVTHHCEQNKLLGTPTCLSLHEKNLNSLLKATANMLLYSLAISYADS